MYRYPEIIGLNLIAVLPLTFYLVKDTIKRKQKSYSIL